ncbi:4-aminobutyrate--2-oxoglutarate transaminase [Amphiplicatus metriothermophilus]|uniref:4-aminobutyrate aminotransferase / (S)-3-amino-2-methylpropionate transaminase n=1 Tax=Amphiplicatus metriothermophilus TaxID=1519374 RepID=A0A239PPV6_9PROT|nr:4-aminobutyrate--2-oxoglutarate transaminase [Amphiplicatus metriothermophilus]MBB5518675.1 4-aminobutyrate aminotransferase [Amphiplicatus metriothermophilus]SNT72168.1 4-aminobutyrate aminotransferase / (S)-3-amino-2-methylpropionate transaminase [Amphiplicatus metriothermophilus]
MDHGKNEFVTNETLKARRDAALPAGLPSKSGIYVARAEGAELWDVEGKRYIDFIGGIGVLNVGHRHPKVVAAVKKQVDAFLHTSFGIAQYEVYVELAERLNRLAPGPTKKKTALFNSGAEAVENAVKFARRITGRPGIVAFEGAFHGRTLLATTLTGKAKPYKLGFGPLVPGVYHAPYPDAYHGVSVEDALEGLDHILKTQIPADELAAIIVEPVQGEGGFNPAPKAFLEALRRICDEHGALLIADEIQSGMGRTGKMFAFEHSGVEPDMICIAKSIAAGLPLSALTGKAELMDKIAAGGMGSTYGGNPVACAAALAVLDVIEEEGLLARAEAIGRRVAESWRALQNGAARGVFGDVRQIGGMIAVECVSDGDPMKPNGEMAGKIQAEARDRGLILTTAGSHAQCLRCLTPLVITDELLDEGLSIFAEATEAAIKSSA